MSGTGSDDELGDPHPRLDDERLAASVLSSDDAQLAAVAGVDEPRRVHDRDPVPRGEARARLDEARVARPGSRPRARCRRGRARPARARRARRPRGRARVARVRARRQHGVRAQPPDGQLDHALGPSPSAPRRRGTARTARSSRRGSRARHETPSAVSSRSSIGAPRRTAPRASPPSSYGTSSRTASNRSAKRSAMRAFSSSSPSPVRAETCSASGNRFASRRRPSGSTRVDLVQHELDRQLVGADLVRARLDGARSARRAAPRRRTRRRRAARGRRRASPRASTRTPRRAGCGRRRMKPTVSVTR